MQSNNFLKKEIGNITNIIHFVAWNEIGHFEKMVLYHKARIHSVLGSPIMKSIKCIPKAC